MSKQPAPPLAIELVLDIIELVAYDEARLNGKSPSLLNCATVCKTWAPISQSLLFKSVALETLRQCVQFVNAVKDDTTKAAFLRDSVRSLEILVSDEEDGKVITQYAFASILKMLPNVQDLRVFYYCLRPLDYDTLDLLRMVPAPTSLSLRCAQDPSPLWDLMTIWPTIQHLEVVSWETPSNAQTLPPKGTWAPYEVRWLDESDSAEQTLPRLLRPGSLRILQLMKIPTDGYFENLMSDHGPYLRSLRLKAVPEHVVSSLAHCNSLEEFKYLQIPSRGLLAALPDTLEHLQIQNGTTRSHTESIQPVIDFIHTRAPRLRVVTYNSCGYTDPLEFRALANLCRTMGVELKCFADNPPLEEKEPLMRPVRFPRALPITARRRPIPIASLSAPMSTTPISIPMSKFGYSSSGPLASPTSSSSSTLVDSSPSSSSSSASTSASTVSTVSTSATSVASALSSSPSPSSSSSIPAKSPMQRAQNEREKRERERARLRRSETGLEAGMFGIRLGL